MSANLQVPLPRHARTSISSESSGTSASQYSESNLSKAETVSSASSNPLVGVPKERLLQDAANFARSNNIGDYVELIQKGALVAQCPAGFEAVSMLSEEEKNALRHEIRRPWSQPKMLYYLVVMCSFAAALQGVRVLLLFRNLSSSRYVQMDESVINGANLFFPGQFGIDPGFMTGGSTRNQWLLGLVNSAPYVRLPMQFYENS